MAKSSFLSVFIASALIIGILCLTIGAGSVLSYYGALFCAISILGFFSFIYTIYPRFSEKIARRITTLFLGFGFGLSIVDVAINLRLTSGVAYSTLLFLGWIVYLKWYSVFPEREERFIFTEGDVLPDLSFTNAEGDKVSNKQLLGKYNIYVFFRGNWCPFCTTQIEAISKAYAELRIRGAEVFLISPQSINANQKLSRDLNLEMHFLRDTDNRAARALKIDHQKGLPLGLQALGYDSDTVMPTVIITDQSDRILYKDLTKNYRIRPQPQEFIAFLDSQK